ncbi:hypothetical protein OOZ19_13220 [Saccharopolyspora sp. NFXS83]|uniref:hypothetical protein n=1 Tax=Saccharopolyspora sp. NFXS83 TaxID=2993560 RepID=UPI00224B6DA2|nr:hypothetical protein [Saccharopolyspora sp. NFXS83]MCX2731206.1 hypothetical protein [Saccharopolyspora sp. NFXS83]
MGDLDDELHRMFADDRLDVRVRTGAEWSLVAGARRRRKRQTTVAAVGGALAMTVLVGGGAVLVARPAPDPVRPAVPPVVSTSERSPGDPSLPDVTSTFVPHAPGRPEHGSPDSGVVPRHGSDPTSERLSILRESTSAPDPTSSEPSDPPTSVPSSSEPTAPTSEPPGEPG